jgi:hypothetical protein
MKFQIIKIKKMKRRMLYEIRQEIRRVEKPRPPVAFEDALKSSQSQSNETRRK